MAIVGEAIIIFKGKDEVSTQLDQIANKGDDKGKSLGQKIMGGLGGVLKTGALAVGAAAGTVLATALFKGWQRLTAIEDAEAKLRGLGHSASAVRGIMDNALASVKGTAFGLDAAATIAASAVAAGVKPGKELESTLKLVADAATIGGTSMEDMGAIFNQVAASNKVQGDTIMSLQNRGIPILDMLSKTMGKTRGEVSKMASEGKVDFDDFRKALQEGVGGAALEAGNTTSGAFKNMGAALARFGATLLSGVFPIAKKVFGGITDILDGMGAKLEPALKFVSQLIADAFTPKGMGKIGEALAPAIAGFKDFGSFITDSLVPAVEKIWEAFGPVITKIAGISLGATIAAFGLLGQVFADYLGPGILVVVDAIVFLKVPLLWLGGFIAAVMIPSLISLGAAWIVGLGPIGWAVGAIIGLIIVIGVIKKHLPELIEWLKSLGEKMGGMFAPVKAKINEFAAWMEGLGDKIGAFFSGLGGRISKALGNLWGKISDKFSSLFRSMRSFVVAAIAVHITFWARLPGRIANALGNMWGKVSSRFTALWSSIRGWITRTFSSIVGFFRQLPGRMAGALGNMWSHFSGKFSALFSRVRTAISHGISNAVGAMRALPGRLASALGSLSSTVGGAISRGLSNMKGRVTSAFHGAGSWLSGTGRAIIEGLMGGIGDMAGAVASKARSVVQGAINAAKSALKSKSPSMVFYQMGVDTLTGYNMGLNATAAAVNATMGRIMSGFGGPSLNAGLNGVGMAGVGGSGRVINLFPDATIVMSDASDADAIMKRFETLVAGSRL